MPVSIQITALLQVLPRWQPVLLRLQSLPTVLLQVPLVWQVQPLVLLMKQIAWQRALQRPLRQLTSRHQALRQLPQVPRKLVMRQLQAHTRHLPQALLQLLVLLRVQQRQLQVRQVLLTKLLVQQTMRHRRRQVQQAQQMMLLQAPLRLPQRLQQRNQLLMKLLALRARRMRITVVPLHKHQRQVKLHLAQVRLRVKLIRQHQQLVPLLKRRKVSQRMLDQMLLSIQTTVR
ncbi:hypothetical protein B817_1671 [Weissella confusa]|nr:hypothetical protein [Weissella confusa]